VILKFNPLHNFISPVTGRLPIPPNYILIGDKNGMSIPSPILIDMRLDLINLRRDVNDIFNTSFILGFPNPDFPNTQVLSKLTEGFMYNTQGIITIKTSIPIGGLPDLTYKHIWLGNSINRPEEAAQIDITNLPPLGLSVNPIYLGKGQIWRGTFSNQAEASNDLSALENSVTILETVTMPAAISTAVEALHVVVTAEIAASAAATLLAASTAAAAAIAIAVASLRLNNISANGDVSFYDYKLINLADPTDPTDGVNLRTLQSYVGTSLTLDGFVTGGPAVNGVLETFRGPTCLLSNIPAGGNVDLGNNRIFNLADATEQYDGVNYNTLWDLLNNQPFYADYITPELKVLGPVQQFIFDINRTYLQISNIFVPTPLINSKSSLELGNSNLSGYRIVQETTDTQNSGDLYIERFIDAHEQGDKFFGFKEERNIPEFYKDLSMELNAIRDLADMPAELDIASENNAVRFEFLFRLLNDEVI
jgi:hypothetical protein